MTADPTRFTTPRLTSLAHGGGCGCKLAPAVLQEILQKMPAMAAWPNLLVGPETSDDAAVYRLNATQAIVATTDFFMPVVDDPFVFGQIAAANALSDIYAMGATPILALALVGMPIGRIDMEDVQQILAGGASVCSAAGIPVAGGHSIDSLEPIYGLVALGLVHPDKVLRNSGALAGDRLILTKGLGVGVFSAALKQDRLDPEAYDALVASATALNSVGKDMTNFDGVHAVTDVTGFGLLGHALEMARGSGVSLSLRWADTPCLRGALALAEAGVRTGAALRNWASYGNAVQMSPDLPEAARDLLCDPQTSGGLLISVSALEAPTVLAHVQHAGFEAAAIIGDVVSGPAGLVIS
jgi:selenide,water dikinase